MDALLHGHITHDQISELPCLLLFPHAWIVLVMELLGQFPWHCCYRSKFSLQQLPLQRPPLNYLSLKQAVGIEDLLIFYVANDLISLLQVGYPSSWLEWFLVPSKEGYMVVKEPLVGVASLLVLMFWLKKLLQELLLKWQHELLLKLLVLLLLLLFLGVRKAPLKEFHHLIKSPH